MSYCIIRAAKLGNAGNLRAALEHNTRERPCEKADPARTPQNEIVVGSVRADEAVQAHAAIVEKLVKQKNSVQAIEYVVACPPDAIERLDGPPEAQNGKYLRDALAWLSTRHGGSHRVIHAAIHRDEQSPHIHVIVVPVAQLARRGGHVHDTLSATQFVGGKKRLAALQTEFAEGVGKPWGLERGISKEITKRLHRPVRDWDAARVAAIQAQDLDGLSPEEMKAIIIKQRSMISPEIKAGPGPRPSSSPTPEKAKIPDWIQAYLAAETSGDTPAAKRIRSGAELMLAEAWIAEKKQEGKVSADGLMGNRRAIDVAKREAAGLVDAELAKYRERPRGEVAPRGKTEKVQAREKGKDWDE